MCKYLLNPEDRYRYTKCSNKRIDFKCPDCEHIQNRKINSVAHRGFNCECCSNGLSYPNKFGRSLFDQLDLSEYKTEYSPTWAKPYVYDIYFQLNGKEYIIEWDGHQHYKTSGSFGKSLAEYQETDKIKNQLAKDNNVHLIRIDCQKSDVDYIRNNIEQSELSKLFNLSCVDWQLCDKHANINLIKEVCDSWMSGIKSFEQLSNKFHLGDSTIRDYINRGVKLGWCDYDSKWWIEHNSRRVKMTNTLNGNEYLFNSVKECRMKMQDICKYKLATDTIKKYSENNVVYQGFAFKVHGENKKYKTSEE